MTALKGTKKEQLEQAERIKNAVTEICKILQPMPYEEQKAVAAVLTMCFQLMEVTK